MYSYDNLLNFMTVKGANHHVTFLNHLKLCLSSQILYLINHNELADLNKALMSHILFFCLQKEKGKERHHGNFMFCCNEIALNLYFLYTYCN